MAAVFAACGAAGRHRRKTGVDASYHAQPPIQVCYVARPPVCPVVLVVVVAVYLVPLVLVRVLALVARTAFATAEYLVADWVADFAEHPQAADFADLRKSPSALGLRLRMSCG